MEFNTIYSGLISGKEKLIEFYRQSDIFVMPSFHETFGLVYAEAMSQGLPVIYSQGEGFDSQFDEGRVGFHVDAHSPESVAEAIMKIKKDYRNIAKNVVGCSKRFSWEKIVARYTEIYQEIVNSATDNGR